MERTSQSVQASSEGEHGGAQSATNKVSGVSADISTLVVGVDGQVETHQLNEVTVVAVAKLVGQVERVVLVLLDRSNLAVLENIAIDLRSNGGQLGNEVHRVFEGVVPVFLLVDTLGVCLSERGLMLQGADGQGELGHGVKSARAAVEELLDELGDIRASGPLGRQIANLLLRGDLTGQEQPEKTYDPLANMASGFFFWGTYTFRKGLLSTRSLGQELLDLGDLYIHELHEPRHGKCGLLTVLPLKRIPSSESRTEPYILVSLLSLLWFAAAVAYLPDEALHTTSTTIGLVEGNFAKDLAAMLPIHIDRHG